MKKLDLNIDRILENWDAFHAVREIIANALDGQALTGTREISIARDDDGLWRIRDFGRGLRHEHFTMNENQEKLDHPGLIGNMRSECGSPGFLARLVRDAGRKVFLILDNLRVRHSKKVRAWLDKHTDLIELFFLPAYSPELSPYEYLNCDLKAQVHGRKPAKNRDELETRVHGAMMKLQNSPGRVKSYFKHSKIQYAAA